MDKNHEKKFHILSIKSTIVLLVIIIGTFLIFNSQAYSSKKKTTRVSYRYELTLWHSLGSYTKEVLNGLITNFNQENSQTQVQGLFQGNEDDLFLQLSKRENLPDIVLIPTQYILPLHEKGIINDITPYITKKLHNDIALKFWNSVTINNRLYGIPYFYDVFVLYVNQNMLWNAGFRELVSLKNWEELINITRKIHELDKSKWGFYIPIDNLEAFVDFIESFTGTRIISTNSITINTPKIASALSLLQRITYDEKLMPPRTTGSEAKSIFLSGNLGFLMAKSSSLVYLSSNFPYNLDVWKLPGNSVKPKITGYCFVITTSDSKRIRESFRFIQFLMNKENSIRWHTHTGSPPLRSSILKSLDLLVFYENNPNYVVPVNIIEQGKIFPKIGHYFQINRIIKNTMDEIMIQKQDPQEGLKEAQEKINKLENKKQ